ncbi:MAG: hypothetical protein HYS12_10710 [Planctomycetes bacterium]|nr:hypothetical protein [Planctomycetota bacterium]
MLRPWFCALLALSVCTTSAGAKDKPAGPDDKNLPGKPLRDLAPGYKTRLIEGFTVLLSKETLANADSSTYERKPLEVLEMELKTLTRIMPARALNILRTVRIWVDWSESKEVTNGRMGSALAVYYGGHQLAMLRKGEHPLRAKSVSILQMKALTLEHQPKRDSGRCVILHEVAHAVHFELLGGNNNLQIKAAFKQAMERKLYDPKMYVATNEAEFFAELSCAYFGQLHHYPRNRADLKKHDPVSYKLMESVWGRPKESAADTRSTGTSSDLPSEDLRLRLEAIALGRPVLGPRLSPGDLKGRAVMLLLWNAGSTSSLSSLPKLSAWDNELREFGLATVGIHLTGTKRFNVAETARSREVAFAITEAPWTPQTPVKEFKEFPLCLVFNHEGRCVFRGVPFDAETPVRTTVGKALVAATGKEQFEPMLAPLVESLQKGKSPSTILPRLTSLTRFLNPKVSEEAKLLVEQLTAVGQKKLEEAEPLMKEQPVEAFLKLERLPTLYADTPVAAKASTLLARLRQTKEVGIELQARPTLTLVKKLDTELRGRPGAFDPTSDKFRQNNLRALRQLQFNLQKMQKWWPMTKATEEAVRIAQRYGVDTP